MSTYFILNMESDNIQVMNYSKHSRSLSEVKISEKTGKRMKFKIEPRASFKLNKNFKSSAYSLSKFYGNFTPIYSSFGKKINDNGCSVIQVVPESTEPTEERIKLLRSIEKNIKCSEKLLVDDKIKVAIDSLTQLSEYSSQIFKIAIGIRDIIEQYIKSQKDNNEEVKNMKKELNEHKQTLKIFSKRFKKLAFENLNLNEKLTETENKYIYIKEIQKSLKKELKEKNQYISTLENNKIKPPDNISLYKNSRKKLTNNTDFNEIQELVDNIGSIDKVSDKIMNFSSIELNSEIMAKDSPAHKKSQSSFIVYF